MEEYKAKVEKE